MDSLSVNLPLSPSEGERDGVRGSLAGSGAQVAHKVPTTLSPSTGTDAQRGLAPSFGSPPFRVHDAHTGAGTRDRGHGLGAELQRDAHPDRDKEKSRSDDTNVSGFGHSKPRMDSKRAPMFLDCSSAKFDTARPEAKNPTILTR